MHVAPERGPAASPRIGDHDRLDDVLACRRTVFVYQKTAAALQRKGAAARAFCVAVDGGAAGVSERLHGDASVTALPR